MRKDDEATKYAILVISDDLFFVIGSIAGFAALQAEEIVALEVVAMFHAESWVHKLLGEYFDRKQRVATVETAFERNFDDFGIVMPENHVLGLDRIDVLFLLLALLDIAVQFTVLGNGMAPELSAATGLLANLKLDTFLFLVLR